MFPFLIHIRYFLRRKRWCHRYCSWCLSNSTVTGNRFGSSPKVKGAYISAAHFFKSNMNTLIGLSNWKQLDIIPTYHYVKFGWFFDKFEVKYLQIANFSEKQFSVKLKIIFSTNLRPKTQKYQSVWFWANLETFSRISPNQEFFFKNAALSLFYLYSAPTSCKKSEKFLEPV